MYNNMAFWMLTVGSGEYFSYQEWKRKYMKKNQNFVKSLTSQMVGNSLIDWFVGNLC